MSLGIRHYAFQAGPDEPEQLLNPLWPLQGKRFLERVVGVPCQNEAAAGLAQDESQKEEFLFDFEKIHLQKLIGLVHQDKEAAAVMRRLCRSSVYELITLVENGDKDAIRTLWDVAHLATTVIGVLGAQDPVIREIAKDELEWPVLKSTNPGFLLSKFDVAELPLAENLFPRLSTKSRFDVSSPLGKIAFLLYRYVHTTRIRARHVAAKRCIDMEIKTWDRVKQSRSLTIEESAALLPDFSNETSDKWWKVAEQCLIEAYQHQDLDIHSKPQLDQRTPILRNLITAKSHIKAGEGTIRRKILEKLEFKFYSFGGHFKCKDKDSGTAHPLKD
jgi:hypothetical protein